jgi:hypothetical protein
MLKMRIEVKGGCVVDYSLTDDGKPVEYECEIVDYDIMDAERICSQCGSDLISLGSFYRDEQGTYFCIECAKKNGKVG